VAIYQRLDRLELKCRAAFYQGVKKIGLGEVFEPDSKRNFQLNTGAAKSQFAFVNLCVKKPSELVMNVKDVSHDFKNELFEPCFIQPVSFGSEMYWHHSSTGKENVGKENGLCFCCLFSFPTFSFQSKGKCGKGR
jgi:hypothetical protein